MIRLVLTLGLLTGTLLAQGDWREQFDANIKQRGHLQIPAAGTKGCDGLDPIGSITKHFDEASYLIGSGHLIYPGSLLVASSLQSGQLVPFKVGASEAELSAFDVLSQPNLNLPRDARRVENPTAGAVQSRVRAILSTVEDPPANVVFSLSQSSSFERALLDVNLAADWLSGQARTTLKNTFEQKKSRFFIRIQQVYITLSRDSVPTGKPSAVFADSSDGRVLETLGSLGEEDTLVYVSSVSYGREIVGAISSDLEESEARKEVQAAQQAFTTSLKAGVKTESLLSSEKYETRFFILGGETLKPLASLEAGLEEWIGEEFNGNRAALISFSTRYLDNQPASFAKAADFPCPQKMFIVGLITDCHQVRGENLDKDCTMNLQVTVGGRVISARKDEPNYPWGDWVELHKGEWDRNGSLGEKRVLLQDAALMPAAVEIQFRQGNVPWNEDPHFRMRLNGLWVLLRDNQGHEYRVPASFDHASTGLHDGNPDHMNFVDNRQSTNRVGIVFQVPAFTR